MGPLGVTLAEKARTAWDGFKTESAAGQAKAVAEAATVPGRTGAAVGPLGGVLQGSASVGWSGFNTTAAAGQAKAVASAGTVPGAHGKALNPLGGVLGGAATTSWGSFQQGQDRKVRDINLDVAAVPGGITRSYGNQNRLLTGQGETTMQGFWDGLKSKFAAVIEWVKGVAAEVARYKGPLEYDRKVLIPAGEAMMSGFLGGLQGGFVDVVRWVSGVAGGVADQMNATVTRAGNLAFAGGDISLNARNTPVEQLLQELIAAVRDSGGDTHVDVRLGAEQLDARIDTRVEASNRDTARRLEAGAGISF